MTQEKGMHPTQAEILRVLLFTPHARFSEMNTLKISNDHFTFHVKRLVELGLVVKAEDGSYTLTASGKEFANRFDADGEVFVVEKQAKLGVLIIVMRGEGNKREYLIQQRLKQPFYGVHGGVTGKIKWGESVMAAATRELKEETGFTARLFFTGVRHKTDYSETGEILDDKYFYIFRAENPKGDFIEHFEGGKNKWLTLSEIEKLENKFDGVLDTIRMTDTDEVEFTEDTYIVEDF